MRAGVRPGLQILWVRLRWTGRFDSDTLPPVQLGSRWPVHGWRWPFTVLATGRLTIVNRQPPSRSEQLLLEFFLLVLGWLALLVCLDLRWRRRADPEACQALHFLGGAERFRFAALGHLNARPACFARDAQRGVRDHVIMTMRGGRMKRMAAGVFKTRCLAVMDEVQAKRQPVLITKRGKPVAKLVPVDKTDDDIFGFLRGKGRITGDIVAPAIDDWGELG
jgi:prevent-host-death family protein